MSLTLRLQLVAVAGVALAVLGAVLAFGSDNGISDPVTAFLGPITMLSYIGVGVYAWGRRPENPFGALMTAVGFVYFLNAPILADDPVLFSVGMVFAGLYLATTVHMLLAFPSGRVQGRFARRLTWAVYGYVLAVNVLLVAVDAEQGRPADAPENVFAIVSLPRVGEVLLDLAQAGGVVLCVLVLRVLLLRWQRATPPQRRSLAPVILPGAAMVGFVGASLAVEVVGLPDWLGSVVAATGLLCFLLLPYAFLVGLGRSRWFRAGAVGLLVERLNDPVRRVEVRDALAEALDDPTLRILYALDGDRWIDAAGSPAEPPRPDADRAAIEVERDGRVVAVLLCDAALCGEPELLAQAASAAALAIDNARLDAELRARVQELQESRSKVVAFGLAERRRLERDLHDGAQQRLVALSLQLKLARARVEPDPASAQRLLDGALEELALAQAELRELARGIHPAILTDRGLDAAVDALVARAPVPVDVVEMPAERLPASVEAAAYFVVAEGLTNVAKYARADHATVAVRRIDGHVRVAVADDGVGGADPSRGTGLKGLRDRLAAIDGRLQVRSPDGEGTQLEAVIPCAS